MTSNQTPPQSLDAERELIGSVLCDFSLLGKIKHDLEPTDFYSTPHQLIWEAILGLDRRGMDGNLVSVGAVLTQKGLLEKIGNVSYLSSLTDTVIAPSPARIESFAKIIKDCSRARCLLLAARRAEHDLLNGRAPSDTAFGLQTALNALGDALQPSEGKIIFANPSYEVGQNFMSLGFKETVLVDDKVRDRNIYVLATNNRFTINERPTVPLGDRRIIFNEKDRILLNLADKWDKEKLTAFTKNPTVPEGLYGETKAVLRDFIEFQDEAHYGLIAAWVIASYFHRCFHAFPFLFFYGKKGTGKSRVLDLLERLCFNAIKIKGISVASLGDTVDAVRGVFLLDQAESLADKQNTELLGILADSYTSGGGKRRVVFISNKNRRVLEFETYSPKAFASAKELDLDLKDRCVEVLMLKATKEYESPEPFLPVWAELRDKLYRLLLMKWQEAKEIYQTAGQGVKHRVRELWRPLDTILTLEKVPANECDKIRQAFLESMEETQTGLTDLEASLLSTILSLLADKENGIFTATEIADKMDLPETETFTRANQTKWVGRTIYKLGLATQKTGRQKNKHSYLFEKGRLEKILNCYDTPQMIGTLADINNIEGLQPANSKTPIGIDWQNGTDNSADLPTSANPQNGIGSEKTVNNQGLCRPANQNPDSIEEEIIGAGDNGNEFPPPLKENIIAPTEIPIASVEKEINAICERLKKTRKFKPLDFLAYCKKQRFSLEDILETLLQVEQGLKASSFKEKDIQAFAVSTIRALSKERNRKIGDDILPPKKNKYLNPIEIEEVFL